MTKDHTKQLAKLFLKSFPRMTAELPSPLAILSHNVPLLQGHAFLSPLMQGPGSPFPYNRQHTGGSACRPVYSHLLPPKTFPHWSRNERIGRLGKRDMRYCRGGSQKAHLECAIMGRKDFGLRVTGPHFRGSESWVHETHTHSSKPLPSSRREPGITLTRVFCCSHTRQFSDLAITLLAMVS